jgi:hypothetical protein
MVLRRKWIRVSPHTEPWAFRSTAKAKLAQILKKHPGSGRYRVRNLRGGPGDLFGSGEWVIEIASY